MNDCLPDTRGHGRRRALLAVLLALTGGGATAVAPVAEDFTQNTWQQWLKEMPRPAIVVFSTTYCPTCPEVFTYLAQAVRDARNAVPLIAVVMDEEGLDPLRRLKHFGHFDRLFVFRGQEAALRFSINPQWRGATPYVALFGADQAPRMVVGKPTADDLQVVLGPR